MEEFALIENIIDDTRIIMPDDNIPHIETIPLYQAGVLAYLKNNIGLISERVAAFSLRARRPDLPEYTLIEKKSFVYTEASTYSEVHLANASDDEIFTQILNDLDSDENFPKILAKVAQRHNFLKKKQDQELGYN